MSTSPQQSSCMILQLPKYLSIRIGPATILPVYVHDHRYCLWQEFARKNRKRAAKSTTNNNTTTNSPTTPTTTGTTTTTNRPVYKPWYTSSHEQELFRILKPFLQSCLFSSPSPVVITPAPSSSSSSSLVAPSKASGTSKKKKQKIASKSKSKQPLKIKGKSNHGGKEEKTATTTTSKNRSLTVREALAQTLSTDRNMQVVRGDNIQFSYQFSHTSSKYWLMVPNPAYARRPPAPQPILIDDDRDSNGAANTQKNDADVGSKSTPHSLDLSSSDDDDDDKKQKSHHQLDIESATTNTKSKKKVSTSSRNSSKSKSKKKSSNQSKSPLKRKRRASRDSEDDDDDEYEYSGSDDDSDVGDANKNKNDDDVDNGDVVVTKVVSSDKVDEYANRFMGFVPWRYSLIIYLEPFNGSGSASSMSSLSSQQRDDPNDPFSMSHVDNPELISYYLK